MHHARSIWTLFLSGSYLKCSNCGFTAYKRVRHRSAGEDRGQDYPDERREPRL